MATSNAIQCPLCEQFAPTLPLYISHLRLVHSKDRSFSVVCGIGGCKEVFGAFSGLNTHVYRHHRAALGLEHPLVSAMSASLAAFEPTDCDFDAIDVGSGPNTDLDWSEASVAEQPCSKSYPPGFSAARFILQLRDGRQVTQVALAEIKEGCNKLCNEAVKELQIDIKDKLESAGIDCDTVSGLNESLYKEVDLFANIGSNYLFEKFCIDHFGYLVSILMILCLQVTESKFLPVCFICKFH